MTIEIINAGKKVTIDINGSIGADVLSADFQAKLNAIEPDATEIFVNITTRGGSVVEGHAMFGMLRETGKRIVTTVVGGALSAGAVLAQAGDERRMHSNALMMVHGAKGGSGASTANDHRSAIAAIDAANSAIAETLSSRTGMTSQRAAELLNGQDYWYTAREAKAAGLIDTIIHDKSAFNAEFVASVPVEVLNELGIQQPEKKEPVIMAEEKKNEPVAATSKEIKASCPGCSADFILAQLDKSATISDVKDAWSDQLANELKAEREKSAAEAAKVETLTNEVSELKKKPGKSGVSPVGGATNSGDGAGDGVDPIATWNELVAAEFQVTKNRQTAMRNCVVNNPDAHKAFIEAYNSTN